MEHRKIQNCTILNIENETNLEKLKIVLFSNIKNGTNSEKLIIEQI